jgi:peptidyl-Lys metalloendopeptidase
MRLGRMSLPAVALAVLAMAAPVAAAERGLSVNLRAQKADLTTSDDAWVHFTVRNTGAKSARVYLPETPLRDVEHDLFRVLRDGEPVAYLGIEAKRGGPLAEDFASVGAGKSVSGWVELTSLYDMSKPGRYTVEYRANLGALTRSAAPADVVRVVKSNELALDVTGEARPSALELEAAAGTVTTEATTSYSKCTSSQISQLPAVLQNASTYAANAYAALGTASNKTAASSNTWNRYKYWFGSYSDGRYTTATSHFGAIADAFATKNITIDCGCKKQYYAYVYPSQPYKIYVCRAFWAAPGLGQDSKAGTLVHEMSHFNVVAGTDDHAYGHSACLSLASSDPAAAVDNADSHEYFAENTKQ